MKIPKEELGVVTVLLERFSNQRLPRLLEMKKRLDQGEKLQDHDLDFLETIEHDRKDSLRIAQRHPELNKLVMQAIDLYHEITSKALENEQKT